jgi:hypothetical protein
MDFARDFQQIQILGIPVPLDFRILNTDHPTFGAAFMISKNKRRSN